MRIQGAYMHCGAEPISYQQLATIPTPDPHEMHHPIPHDYLFRTALEVIHDTGYDVGVPNHFVNRDGAHYFSVMELTPRNQDIDPTYSTLCALRNSHDKTFSASIAIGARVFVCDNLSFSGDIVVGRKHTPNIILELPSRLEYAVKRIAIQRKKQEVRFNEYRLAPLDDYTADHLIMEAYRHDIINLQRIGKVHDEWREPTADHGDKTIWRFFNACTAALKPKSNAQLIHMPKKTIDLHLMLDKFCELGTDLDQLDAIDQAPDGDTEIRVAATVN